MIDNTKSLKALKYILTLKAHRAKRVIELPRRMSKREAALRAVLLAMNIAIVAAILRVELFP